MPQQADREYLRVLHLAASTSESEVELALAILCLRAATVPTSEAVRGAGRALRGRWSCRS